MRVIFKQVNETGQVNIQLMITVRMKEILKMGLRMEKEFLNGLMDEPMMENGI